MADRKNINFLEEANRKAAIQAKQDKKMLRGALVGMVAVALAWAGLLGYNVYLETETSRITLEADELDREMLAFSAGQLDYLTFINKTKAISEIIGLRNNALELIIEAVDHLATNTITITSINYSMQERVIMIRFTLTDVFAAAELFERLADQEFRDLFQSIDYGSLSRSERGTYSTSLELNI